MKGVDNSTWDKWGRELDSDDDQVVAEDSSSDEDPATSSTVPSSGVMTKPGPTNLVACFVKLAPGDSGSGLDPVYFLDPRTYEPPSPLPLDTHGWGLPLIRDESMLMRQMRVMTMQMHYAPLGNTTLEKPECSSAECCNSGGKMT